MERRIDTLGFMRVNILSSLSANLALRHYREEDRTAFHFLSDALSSNSPLQHIADYSSDFSTAIIFEKRLRRRLLYSVKLVRRKARAMFGFSFGQKGKVHFLLFSNEFNSQRNTCDVVLLDTKLTSSRKGYLQ
jgi:hypothetical protein